MKAPASAGAFVFCQPRPDVHQEEKLHDAEREAR
jgi:hypothetical protein